MKNSIQILCIVLVTALTLRSHFVLAQAPQAIPYQAVARNSSGSILSNQAISLQLSIHDATATGTIVYKETQTITTNSLGLFNINIGQGTVITGTLSDVNWAIGSKFIQVEMDPTGGTSYTDMGTTQLMSVPYALSSADNQWTKSGNNISSSNSGNVGIGTSSTNAKLEVVSISDTALLSRADDPNSDKQIGILGSYNAFGFGAGVVGIGYLGNIPPANTDIGVYGSAGISGPFPGVAIWSNGKLKVSDGTQGTGKVLTSDANGLASWQSLAAVSSNIGSTINNRIPKWNGTTLVDGNISNVGSTVGIGIDTPTSGTHLHLHNSDGAANTILHISNTSNSILSYGFTNSAEITCKNSLTSDRALQFWNQNSSALPTSKAYDFLNHLAVPIFTILDSGNVGIGTSSPAAKLDVNGTIKISGGNPSLGKVLTSDATGLASWQTPGAINETDPQVSSTTTNKIPKWNGTALVDGAITDNGTNVGIGTTAPGDKLSIRNGALSFHGPINDVPYVGIDYDSTTDALRIRSNIGTNILNTTQVTINRVSGDVGIGTTTPAAKLDINGAIKISGGNPAAGKVLTSDSTGIASWQTLASITETDPQVSSTTTNKIPKWNGTTLVDGIISNVGNTIGIGIDTPASGTHLHLHNVIQTPGTLFRISNTNNGFTNSAEIACKNSTSSDRALQFWNQNSSALSTSRAYDFLNHSATSIFTIFESGNIGIGTSVPSAKLDINGTIKISGGSPALGYVLTSDATGLASWQTPAIPAETDPKVSSTTSNKIPKWNGTALVDGVITDNGTNIGIGTTTPGAKLHVNGILRAQADVASNKAIELYKGNGTPAWEMYVQNTGLSICEQGVACDRFVVAAGGNIGIGTNAPSAPLHIAGSPILTASLSRTYFTNGTALTSGTAASGSIQVRADGWFWANNGGFVATSDQRIKNKLGLTNTQCDLNDLSKIEITNYKYIDQINNGSKIHKKVIAQQLNSVYPLAVDTTKGIIPNVYEVAKNVSVKNNSTLITTNKAHDFKTGDEVKLIIENMGEKIVHVVVIDAHTFSVNEIINDKVFVFGKHVDDLLVVDYDALTTLNISATQELLKRIQSLEKENAQLKELNETYNAKLLNIEDKLNILLPPSSTTTAQK